MKDLTENEKIVVEYLNSIETRKSSDVLDKYYHPEIQQIEFPNAVVKNTTLRNLKDLKDGSERGQKIMSKEEYEIKELYSFNNIVILEAIWNGTVSVPIGNIPAGGKITAYFAQFFEFKDNKIYRQRNYDCFEPFK